MPTDSFNGADGLDLVAYSSSWTHNAGSLQLLNNEIRGTNNTHQCYHWNDNFVFTPDQFSETIMVAGTRWVGPTCRADLTGAATFLLWDTRGNGDSFLVKSVNGSITVMASASDGARLTGDVLRLETIGSVIRPLINGALSVIGEQNDTSISSGAAGVGGYGSSSGSRQSSWEGGNLSNGNVNIGLISTSINAFSNTINVDSPLSSTTIIAGLNADSIAGSVAASTGAQSDLVVNSVLIDTDINDLTLSVSAVLSPPNINLGVSSGAIQAASENNISLIVDDIFSVINSGNILASAEEDINLIIDNNYFSAETGNIATLVANDAVANVDSSLIDINYGQIIVSVLGNNLVSVNGNQINADGNAVNISASNNVQIVINGITINSFISEINTALSSTINIESSNILLNSGQLTISTETVKTIENIQINTLSGNVIVPIPPENINSISGKVSIYPVMKGIITISPKK